MPYSDEHGYASVDRDAVYLVRFRRLLAIAVAIGTLILAIPGTRDWAWRTFLPGNYAAAHRKPVSDAELDQAAINALADLRTSQPRQDAAKSRRASNVSDEPPRE